MYGNCNLTLHCLKSLAAINDENSVEVIVVDDASTDASGDVLSAISGLRYLRNEENLGFCGPATGVRQRPADATSCC